VASSINSFLFFFRFPCCFCLDHRHTASEAPLSPLPIHALAAVLASTSANELATAFPTRPGVSDPPWLCAYLLRMIAHQR